MADKFPHTLYRPGTSLRWNGLDLDTRVVADEAGLKAAEAKGWQTIEDLLAPKSKVKRNGKADREAT